MIFEEIQDKVQKLTQKVFDEAQMDLVDLKITGHKNDVNIQITADKPSGGINIHECAILNKRVVAAIEQEKLLPPEVFSLELSSPGLDRPLVTRKDFMRCVGQELHFWLNEACKGKKEIEGVLNDVGETALTIHIAGKTQLVLPLTTIIKGVLVV